MTLHSCARLDVADRKLNAKYVGAARVLGDTVVRAQRSILAELLHAQGKDVEAEPFCREVLVGFTKALGEEHPFTISSAENLVGVLRSLGKREDECQHLLDRFGLKEPPPRRGNGPPRGEIQSNGSELLEVD